MGIFGKGRQAKKAQQQATAIADFWQWWNTEGSRAWAQQLGGDLPEPMVHDLGTRVHAIDPGLAWETAAGTQAAHLLVISAEGDPALRAVARRWLQAAPEADFVWSYADARQPMPDLSGASFEIDGQSLAVNDAVLGVRRQGTRVDVTLHHPAFASLSKESRSLALFLLLDAALGEQQTETWIGELTPSEVPPLDGFGPAGLRAVVRDLAAENLDENGEPAWVLMEGQGPAGAVMAMAQVPLAAAMFPLFATHVLIQAAYGHRAENGLPQGRSLESLQELEDELNRALGRDGRLVAHETSAGVRQLHVYVDPETEAAARVELSVRAWEGNARFTAGDDPGWAEVQHLRG